MKKISVKRITTLRRVLGDLRCSFVRLLGLDKSESVLESGSHDCSNELFGPYVPYDELRRVKLQLLELERQRAEAICLNRRRGCE